MRQFAIFPHGIPPPCKTAAAIRQHRPSESLFRPLVLSLIEKADSPASRSVYPLVALFLVAHFTLPVFSSLSRKLYT
jgi:hypothetical protein